MPDPQTIFHANIKDADALTGIYDFLQSNVGGPVNYDDLLRSKIVYAVSAFDKLIHDLIRVGMVDTFLGKRKATPKYLSEALPMSVIQQLAPGATPPPEVVFENAVRNRLKIMSFQEPTKVADGLSYIWDEPQKWHRVAASIGSKDESTRTQLKLIADRRNSIVHEADLHPLTHAKLPITRKEAGDVLKFLLDVGNAICTLTK